MLILSGITAVMLAPVPARADQPLHRPRECTDNVRHVEKQRECLQCVQRPRAHAFWRNDAPGRRCRLVSPGPDDPIWTAQECRERITHKLKLGACVRCVQAQVPHRFLPNNPEGTRCVQAR
jgi:hypothetical protein